MRLYFISGLGANSKAFDRILPNYQGQKVFIDWLMPEKKEDLSHYAERMAENINVNEPFALVGLSFGGIIAQEFNRFLNPEQTFLISSIQSGRELRPGFKVLAKTGLNKKIPANWVNNETLLTYALARRAYYSKKTAPLDTFFTFRDSKYILWSIDQIINWKGDIDCKNRCHIHGTSDVVFPIRFLKNVDHKISKGSHLMVFNKADQINEILLERLG